MVKKRVASKMWCVRDVPVDLREEFVLQCQEEGVTVSAVIVQALEEITRMSVKRFIGQD